MPATASADTLLHSVSLLTRLVACAFLQVFDGMFDFCSLYSGGSIGALALPSVLAWRSWHAERRRLTRVCTALHSRSQTVR